MDNRKSVKLKYTSENTLKIVNELLKNQNLLRLIHYLDDDPLSIDKADVSPKDFVYNGYNDAHFYLTFFNKKMLRESKIVCFFNPSKFNFPRDNNSPLGKDNYVLHIIIPHKYWVFNGTGQLRNIEIAAEICESIDQQTIAGIGEVNVYDIVAGNCDENYGIITLQIYVDTEILKE